eukprot:1181411-Prorocentrum_minimum.AAC.10
MLPSPPRLVTWSVGLGGVRASSSVASRSLGSSMLTSTSRMRGCETTKSATRGDVSGLANVPRVHAHKTLNQGWPIQIRSKSFEQRRRPRAPTLNY